MKIPAVLSWLILCLALMSPVAGADARWQVVRMDAPSLEGNVLGDPASVFVGIHLPASYQEGGRRYPVVYFLSGYGCGKGYLDYVGGVLARPEMEKAAGEAIVVVVWGENRLGGAFYEDSTGTGGWETFVVETLVGHVDRQYRTLPKREARAITGLSMGGYGAINLALRHPEKFSVCYAMSPGLFAERGLEECQMFKNGGTVREVVALQQRLASLSAAEAATAYSAYLSACKDEDVLFTLAYATTYAPAPGRAPYFKMPYSVDQDGRLVRDEAVWKKFEGGYGNFAERLRTHGESVRRYALFAVNCGFNDEYAWIVDGTRYFQGLLCDLKLPHAMIWHAGTHVGRFEQELAGGLLPEVTAALARE